MMNVPSLLVNSARKHPQKTALVSGEKRFTYQVFNQRVNRLAHAMARNGVKKGGRVGIFMYNTHHFVETYFAGLKIGAIGVPINFRFVGEEVRFIVDHAEPDLLFFDSTLHSTVAGIREKLASVRHFVQTDASPSGFAEDYEAFLDQGNAEEPDVSVNADDPCQIMYTSGTTGKPKGAILSHHNILWNLFNTVVGREHRPGEISLIIGPLFHTAALNNHFTVQVALGGTSVLIRKFDPETVLASIEKEKVSVISGSPAVYNLLLQYPDRQSFDTRSVTTCTSGSAILPDEIKLRLKELFPNAAGISDLYGCTEASPTIATLSLKDSMRKQYSVGQAVPFVEVMIVDDDNKPLPSGQVGELICRGPNVMQEYYKAPEASEKALQNGWLYTGDLGRMDEDGYIYIVDRKKDMIVSGGENIYPREIEEVLLRHPVVVDAAVVGVPHELWGETVKAYVVVKDGAEIDEQGIVNFCKEHLASYKKPTIVEITDAIPNNPAGKPLKRLLR